MVALQILVLPAQVRVLVPQRKNLALAKFFFYTYITFLEFVIYFLYLQRINPIRVMRTSTKVQTAFRLETDLLNRLKRKARARGQSLNSYVENVLMKDSPLEPELPKIEIPDGPCPLVEALRFPEGTWFTEEEIAADWKLQRILKIDCD